jgi:hypothetical protein
MIFKSDEMYFKTRKVQEIAALSYEALKHTNQFTS